MHVASDEQRKPTFVTTAYYTIGLAYIKRKRMKKAAFRLHRTLDTKL